MCSNRLREEIKANLAGQVLFDEPLSRHTSWKVGGPAEILVTPVSIDDLRTAVLIAWKNNVPVTILGNGTNVLVADRGVEGLTIKMRGLRNWDVSGERITAEAGVNLPELSRIAQGHNLSGLEFAAGIPASVGGAVVSNAGAHGSSMQDIVRSVLVMDYQGALHTFAGSELGFGYRSSMFRDGRFIVLQSVMDLEPMPGEQVKEKMQHYLGVRSRTQPVESATAGSVFVNPASVPAGLLIEKAGLKGAREGGAQVSHKHANFIVNADNATASDIVRLIRRIQEQVYSMFGIKLETEIRFLGGEVP
ncbi:MAG: UDP-N-acetylmuramate dehydrogenase [Bacillota bacterium]|jgi:UDP-N-acetylmuramate dehydrogenase